MTIQRPGLILQVQIWDWETSGTGNTRAESVDSGGNRTGSSTWGTANTDGTFKATFTWNDAGTGKSPPKSIIVKKVAQASWSGDSGSCDPGLDNPEVEVSSPEPGETMTATEYELLNEPGSSFTMEVECSANASLSQNSTSGLATAVASVQLTLSAHEVKINLSGVTISSTGNKILIGQKLTASISVDNLSIGAGSTYDWVITEGKPFSDYNAPTTPVVVTWWSKPETSSSYTDVYFAEADSDATVSCTANFPDIGIGPVSLSEDIDVDAPTVNMLRVLDVGKFKIGESLPQGAFDPFSSNPNGFRMHGGTFNGVEAGVVEVANISYDHATFGTSAKFGWVQITNGHALTQSTGQQPSVEFWPQSVSGGYSYALDGDFPYYPWSNYGSSGAFSDRPGIQGFSSHDYLEFNAIFRLFIMFQPPGTNSKFVPLRVTDWVGKGHANKSVGAWTGIDDGSQSNGTQTVEFPVWQEVV